RGNREKRVVRERRGDVGHVIGVEPLERALDDREVVALGELRRAWVLELRLVVPGLRLGRLVGRRPHIVVVRCGLLSLSLEKLHGDFGVSDRWSSNGGFATLSRT